MREYTATVYLFKDERTLLVYHPKHRKWVPPGGHVEINELPSEAAIREAKEETGLDIELLLQENLWFEPQANGKSIPRPYLTLLEEIPVHKDQPPHQHIDMVYVGRPIGGELIDNQNVRWMRYEEVMEIPKEELFEESLEIIAHLFKTYRSLPSDQAYALA